MRKLYHEKLTNAKALITTSETEKRAMKEDEATKYDGFIVEAGTLKTQIKAMELAHELEEEDARAADGVVSKNKAFASAKGPKYRGIGEFLTCVRNVETKHVVDPRLIDDEKRATGINESVPSDGGFLVPMEYSKELLKDSYDASFVAKKTKKSPVKGNGMTYKRIDQTSRVEGSRHGGMQIYWLNEGGTVTPTRPKFREMELKLKKIIGMYYASDEILEDAIALEADINEIFIDEFAFKIDDAVINGSGSGMPLGIMKSPCLIEVAKESGQAATTLLYENLVKMWSRMWAPSRRNAVWYINQDVEPQLLTMSLAVGVGGAPVYMAASGASGTPYATLFGRPIIPIEQCQTLGTKGDVIFADPTKYKMIDKNSLNKSTSIHVQFTTDETAFRFTYRADGTPTWNSALTPAHGTNTLSPFVTLADR